MTKASEGLRLGAARQTLKLGELSAEDVLAGISAETRTAVAAALAAEQPKVSTQGEGGDPAEPPVNPDPAPEGDATDFTKGQAAERDRTSKVLASEHFAGREKLAAKLLASSMSADEVIGALAEAPKATESDASDVLAAMRASNPDLGAGGSGEDAAAAAAKADNHGWAKAHAKVAERYGAARR